MLPQRRELRGRSGSVALSSNCQSSALSLNHIIWPKEQGFVSGWLLSGSLVCREQAEMGGGDKQG